MSELIRMNEEQLRDIAAKNVTKIISNSGVLSAREEVEYPLFLPKGKDFFHKHMYIFSISQSMKHT